jgi:RNA 3'-terminal phosphate cyclase (ATP)
MLELDGSDGGGQLLRTALALSAVLDEPFRMTGIRGDRPEPGLKPQHLAAVAAVAAACDAEVDGDDRGSEELAFEPGGVRGGEYEVDIATAGSVFLVFDAVLPLAVALDPGEELVLRATGGTDVKWAPTTDHYRRVKLPLVRRTGVEARAFVDRRGFYPAGGARATLRLGPPDGPADALDLAESGDLERVVVRSVAAQDLFDARVAERGAETAAQELARVTDVPVETATAYDDTVSPGAVVGVQPRYDDSRAGFDALGERGKPMETVAEEAVAAFAESGLPTRTTDGSGPAVDRHTADQLAVVLALVGGTVTTPRATDHLRTNRDLVAAFGGDLELDERADRVALRCREPLSPADRGA